MENRDIRDLFCGWAEGKGRGSRKHWVLLIEEEMSNKIIEVNLTDVFSKCFKRGVCQGHSSLNAPSELNPPQRIPSPLFTALLVPQAEG